MRMKDKGGTIDIELNIMPQNIEAKEEFCLIYASILYTTTHIWY
jgi:hypothetical protein